MDYEDIILLYRTDTNQLNIDQNTISVCKNGKTYVLNIDDDCRISSTDNSIDNDHMVKILEKHGNDDICDTMDLIANMNVYEYCISCQDKMDIIPTKYIPCGKKECISKINNILIDDIVIEKFKYDKTICEFIIDSARDAINSPKNEMIFDPFPEYFYKDGCKDFAKIKETLEQYESTKISDMVNTCSTDQMLLDKIGKDLYYLIRFILMSCTIDIQINKELVENNKIVIYDIIQKKDKIDEFNKLSKNMKVEYLFHGSSWCNWYSILRNGLKNCSGTKLMANGAAHGNGIYLSNDINLAYDYGIRGNGSISVVGVFEVINKDKYKKTEQIYVVNDDTQLIQRFLLIIPKNKKALYMTHMNALFNTEIHEKKAVADTYYNTKSIRKLALEYKKIKKLKNIGYTVNFNENNFYVWRIFIMKIGEDSKIYDDMKKYNIDNIELEIKFSNDYPFSPPFLRVVRPRFQYLTGHITKSGSWCNELLTSKGWTPACSLDAIISVFITELLEGGGRIDPKNYHIEYSFDDAYADYIRVAKSHGWL
jgi:ubiquitin-protein ligase